MTRAPRRLSRLAGRRAPQAFPDPRQAFPNFEPFSPNFSKDSFGRFVGNQRLARRKRKISFCSKFLAPAASPKPAPGAAATTDVAPRDIKKPSTPFVFQKDNVGVRKQLRVHRRRAGAEPGRR
jgi:hypothetical protein